MTRKSRWTSASDRAEVGSSMIRIAASNASALAISTICWSPIRRSPIRARGLIGVPRRSNSRRASASIARSSSQPSRRPSLLAAEEDVGGDGHLGDEVQLLVDDPDTGILGLARARERHGAAVEDDLALVVGDRAGEDLHQRALARAVLAAERVDLARPRRQAHVAQGVDAAEVLGDVPHLESEDGVAHWHSSSAGT